MAMGIFEQSELCRAFCSQKVRGRDVTVYTIPCMDGMGTMSGYEVFPGIEIFRCHFHAHSCNERRAASDLLQLNFCVSGRFECHFTKQECSVLGPGDFSASLFDGKNAVASTTKFPLGYYEGLSIYVDCAAATKWTEEHLGVLSLDFGKIRNHLLPLDWKFICRAGPECGHIFMELYENASRAGSPYILIKTVELFTLLQELPLTEKRPCYFPKEQIELVRHLREHIISGSSGYPGVEQLALDYGISVTQLQKVFRKVYGMPVYAYLREYRLEQATLALKKTDESITSVALAAGFTNPGKFSEAFKKRYAMTPTEYRKGKIE
ncbi:MAG: AraC family transcriptional regulator [Acetatifactor muris]|nr:AraC family transcriptional regulator [Acetatifactor muris]